MRGSRFGRGAVVHMRAERIVWVGWLWTAEGDVDPQHPTAGNSVTLPCGRRSSSKWTGRESRLGGKGQPAGRSWTRVEWESTRRCTVAPAEMGNAVGEMNSGLGLRLGRGRATSGGSGQWAVGSGPRGPADSELQRARAPGVPGVGSTPLRVLRTEYSTRTRRALPYYY